MEAQKQRVKTLARGSDIWDTGIKSAQQNFHHSLECFTMADKRYYSYQVTVELEIFAGILISRFSRFIFFF